LAAEIITNAHISPWRCDMLVCRQYDFYLGLLDGAIDQSESSIAPRLTNQNQVLHRAV